MSNTEPTVLIIDDDAEIRYSLDRVLVSQGLVVISADSGEKGIETAKTEKPTLIFWIIEWVEYPESKRFSTSARQPRNLSLF